MIIDERTYSAGGQQVFAQLSGDYNPLHLDPIVARREMFGGVVVHGMNAALTALDAYLNFASTSLSPNVTFLRLSIRFLGPIYVGDHVATRIRSSTVQTATLVCDVGGFAVVEIKAEYDLSGAPMRAHPPVQRKPANVAIVPHTRAVHDILDAHGSLELYLDLDTALTLYPHLATSLRAVDIASLLAVTRLVGMEYPGMQSVFQSFTATIGVDVPRTTKPSLHFRVRKVDTRFGLVALGFDAPGITGAIQAFARPKPQMQPTMDEVCALVNPSDFVGHNALIIGGSRGLGETCAKIIAAGGGIPTITYCTGEEDARRVANEIRAAGYMCSTLHCDIRSPASMLDEVLAKGFPPTQLYYFATPKIGVKRHHGYSRDALNKYLDYYVDGFAVMCDAFRLRWGHRTSIFYPSTVYVSEVANHMDEYASAKAAGETAAHYLAMRYPMLRIIVERLPRLATDQTLSLVGAPPASALPTLLAIVRNMSTTEPDPSDE